MCPLKRNDVILRINDVVSLRTQTQKERHDFHRVFLFGAGSGGRTRTVSLPLDFESSTSANSIIPAIIYAVFTAQDVLYHIVFHFAIVFLL